MSASDMGGSEGPSGGNEAGSNGDGGGNFGDGGGGEDAPGSDAGAARLPSALFVNASASLPAVRLCWSIVGGVPTAKPFPQQIMPASNYAGIAAGGTSFMSNASTLAHGPLELDVIPAKLLANLESGGTADLPCDQLICTGPHCLTPQKPTEYWALSVPPLTEGVTNVIALEGCLAQADDANANVARCGADWTATAGNLQVQVTPLTDAKGAQQGTLFVQAAQLSPGLASLLGSGGSATVSLGTANAANSSIADLGAEGEVLPSSPVGLALSTLELADYGTYGIRIDVSGVDAGPGNLFMSLAQAQQLVDPSVDPKTFYSGGGTYLVAVVGDPNAPHAFSTGTSGPYDGTGLHVLVVRAQVGP
jgi:hypothetical protein